MLTDFFEDFVRQDMHTCPDGFGGTECVFTDGETFRAGITTNNSAEMRLAAAQALKTTYTIVTDKGVNLTQFDRVKRVSSGRVYIVTSNAADMSTPAVAGVRYHQVSAEVVDV